MGTVVHKIQNTDDWTEYRKGGVGASEVPAVLDESDFMTPRQLWEIKTGNVKPSEPSFIQMRGHDAEMKIRATYHLMTGFDAEPRVFQHAEYPHIRASLDGFDEKENVLSEFKFLGAEKHALVENGKVPRTYYGQIQTQLLVSGARLAHFVSYNGSNIAIVEVLPDLEYIERIIREVTAFWALVQNRIPPPMTARDVKNITSVELLELVDTYKALKNDEDVIQKELERVKGEILKHVDHPRARCGDLLITKVEIRGPIDYSKVPLGDVDLEQYRKAPSAHYKFTLKEAL